MPHDHNHHVSRDHQDPRPEFDKLLNQLLGVLDACGILTPADVTAQIADMEGRTPLDGARLVAKCWMDPEFLALALKDLPGAATKIDIKMPSYPKFVLLENTPELHHVVVCTLCSCYPRPILGPPPLWYKSRNYRSRVVAEPRAVLAEFGTVLPEGVKLKVVDSTADCRYLVLPVRPKDSDGLSETELAALVERDSMIGVKQVSV